MRAKIKIQVIWRWDMQREFVVRVDGRGVDDDAGTILVYRLGDQVSLVATAEKNGDAEVILDKAATSALAEALRKVS
jgi:hypothetical protein